MTRLAQFTGDATATAAPAQCPKCGHERHERACPFEGLAEGVTTPFGQGTLFVTCSCRGSA